MKSMISLIFAALMQAVPNVPPGTGAVCGHVDAPSTKIAALELDPNPGNIVVARSGSEAVSTNVGLDGNFCFKQLRPELHTITAFGDSPAEYQASVLVVAGKTRYVEVRRNGGL